MSIENKSLVDGISLCDGENAIAMLIYDNLDWSDEFAHLMMIQSKINAYLDYLETRQYLSLYPNNEYEYGIIDIRFTEPFTENCSKLLETTCNYLESEGIRVEISVTENSEGFEFYNVEIDDVFYYNDEFESFVAVINNIAFMTKKVTPEVKEYANQLAEAYANKYNEILEYIYNEKDFKHTFPDISKTDLSCVLGEPVLIFGESKIIYCSYCNVKLENSPMFEFEFSDIFEDPKHFCITN